jgi:hypothetical protein
MHGQGRMPYLAIAASRSGNRPKKLNKNLERKIRKRDSCSKYLRKQLYSVATTQTHLVFFSFTCNKARLINIIKNCLPSTHSNFHATTKL